MTPERLDHQLLDLAARLAVAAGRMVRAGRSDLGVQAVTTKSTDTDMVTEFDRASEQLIVGGILSARPHDTIVGEEGTDTVGTSGVSWCIDPIDGTTNFLYGLPGYAVSIAAAVDGVTRAGAVYVPSNDELFTAALGAGARLDGRPISCSTTTDLHRALVATGFAYSPERRAEQAGRVARLLPHIRDIRRLGAAAPDLCNLAAGRVDAYFEEGLGAWDFAAGALIAGEAGCLVGGIAGGEPSPAGVLAASPAIFPQLRAALLEIDAEGR
jgi:myo-inositol-1(or 4)-monophosphatase